MGRPNGTHSPAGAYGGGSGSSKGRPQNPQNAVHWAQFLGPFLARKAGPEWGPCNRNVYVGELQKRSQKGSQKLLQLPDHSGDYRVAVGELPRGGSSTRQKGFAPQLGRDSREPIRGPPTWERFLFQKASWRTWPRAGPTNSSRQDACRTNPCCNRVRRPHHPARFATDTLNKRPRRSKAGRVNNSGELAAEHCSVEGEVFLDECRHHVSYTGSARIGPRSPCTPSAHSVAGLR